MKMIYMDNAAKAGLSLILYMIPLKTMKYYGANPAVPVTLWQ